MFGDKGILVHFGNELDEERSRTYINCARLIGQDEIDGVTEVVVSFVSILVFYDPLKADPGVLIEKIRRIIERSTDEIILPPSQVYEVPTLYGGEYGPDLEYVAEYHGITPEEVIGIHTENPLWVYYLSMNFHNLVPEQLITPRRNVPRLKIHAGDVGIGNRQTGPYVIDVPGGWNIIGRTPLKLYDPYRDPPFLFEIGNYFRYRSIDEDEFKAIEASQSSGT